MALELFVSPDDIVTVNFAVGADKNDPTTIYADVSVEKLKEVYEDDLDEATVEKHHAVFRRPSYNDVSKLHDEAFAFDGESLTPRASSVRMNKIMRLLKSWSLSRPATAQEVRLLHPVIALVIGSELERLAP